MWPLLEVGWTESVCLWLLQDFQIIYLFFVNRPLNYQRIPDECLQTVAVNWGYVKQETLRSAKTSNLFTSHLCGRHVSEIKCQTLWRFNLCLIKRYMKKCHNNQNKLFQSLGWRMPCWLQVTVARRDSLVCFVWFILYFGACLVHLCCCCKWISHKWCQ